MNNIPKLRFPEFTDAWEKCKLGEVGKTYTGLSGKTKEDFGHGQAKFITYMNVFGNPIASSSGVDRIEIDSRQNEVKFGDVFFTTSSETPEEVGMSSIWLENTENVYLNSFCFGYRPIKIFDPYFFAFYLRSPSIRAKIILLAQGISRYNISKTKMMEQEISIPTLPEQQKIGNLFKQLDRLITLHKRKWDDVILLKKALLQKMFPKNGSDFPEIRFPEFTDAWEKCKLGEIATINPKSTLPQTFNYVDLESVVGTEMRSYKIEKLYSAPSRAQRLAKYGDIFYQTVRPYQKNNYLFELDDENYVFSTGYAQIRSKIYPYFLFTLIQNDRFVNEVLDNCTGTSYPAINAIDLKNITIFISNNPTEQQKIGNLFKQLDRLITLHKRQHEHYQLLKKALLQQMFV